jgi:hypothetical protein
MAKALWIAALAYGAVCAVVWFGMGRPPEQFAHAAQWAPTRAMFALMPLETLWKSARAGNLRPGDPAPDFELPAVAQPERVRLSSHRGVRPVLLVFGSYS